MLKQGRPMNEAKCAFPLLARRLHSLGYLVHTSSTVAHHISTVRTSVTTLETRLTIALVVFKVVVLISGSLYRPES